MKDCSHDEAIAKGLREDPSYAALLLEEVRRDGNLAELKILLRQLAIAFGDGNEDAMGV